MDTLRIATRKSPLALWQAEDVKRRLEALHPDLAVELVTMTTRGDVLLDSPLAKIGGKGLFVKELEVAMLEGRADIAVHSVKDVPATLPEGLHISRRSSSARTRTTRSSRARTPRPTTCPRAPGSVPAACAVRRSCSPVSPRCPSSSCAATSTRASASSTPASSTRSSSPPPVSSGSR